MNINIYLLLLYVVMKQFVKIVMIKKMKMNVHFVKKKKMVLYQIIVKKNLKKNYMKYMKK